MARLSESGGAYGGKQKQPRELRVSALLASIAASTNSRTIRPKFEDLGAGEHDRCRGVTDWSLATKVIEMDKNDLRRAGMLAMFLVLVFTAPQWLNARDEKVSSYSAPWIYPSLQPSQHQ